MSGPGTSTAKGFEVAPLSHRVAAMSAFRMVMVCGAILLAWLSVSIQARDAWLLAAYLLITSLLSALVLTPWSTVAVKAFGIGLLVDSLFLQFLHERLGHSLSVDVLVAAQLVAVCLLGSFRTGLKLGVWQSLLMVIAWRSEEAQLVPQALALAGAPRDRLAATDMALIWLVVLTTSVAASINERELRRRRYDAEALERLAATFLSDDNPGAVVQRLVQFVVGELGAVRAVVVVRERAGGESLVMRVLGRTAKVPTPPGLSGPAGTATGASAMIDLALTANVATLALRLDPRRDATLAALLPDGERIAAIPLGRSAHDAERPFLVVEFGPASWRGGRVERRTVTAATQAAATAAIALSRTELLERNRRAALTDALTSIANRRAFDATMAEHERAWRERGATYALVLIDVDHFKSVNDRFGHQIGDDVLVAVGRVLREQALGLAMPARYGGEEFALILPGADAAAAAALAERVRAAIGALQHPVPVTASFGVAAVPGDAADSATVVHAADAALIRAKGSGRNRVEVAANLVTHPDAAASDPIEQVASASGASHPS